MKKSSTNDYVRIKHIAKEIKKIRSFSDEMNSETFKTDEKTQYACIRSLEVIGEASNYLTNELQAKYSNVEWSQLIGLRNLLIHNYFGVDTELVWEIITVDISDIEKQIEMILSEINPAP
ncbi:MAG: hypothetical protein ACI9V1_002489 [Spirosomataceae bacterium]|jgi:uncharacterized protein with HEPN domain